LTINTRENLLGCEIYISDNKPLFNFLKEQQSATEQQLGTKVEWIEAKKANKVVQRRDNANIDDEAGTTTLFDWLIDRGRLAEPSTTVSAKHEVSASASVKYLQPA
jgi:hypothetical protein